MSKSLCSRLEKLEGARSNGFVVLWRHETETDEHAKARWRAENPGKDLEQFRLKVIIVHFGDPQPTSAQAIENGFQ